MSKDAPHYSMRLFWSDEDRSFIALCPELGELSAFGATAEEAVHELQAAVGMALEVYEEDGEAIPHPVTQPAYSGQFRVRLPRSLHGQLVEDAKREGVSLNVLVIQRLTAASAVDTVSRMLIDRLEAKPVRLSARRATLPSRKAK
jgi:predicted HicB family RNase H-like nuclease